MIAPCGSREVRRLAGAAGLAAAFALLVPGPAVLAAAPAATTAAASTATKIVAIRSEREGKNQVVRLETDGRPGGTVEKRAAPLRLVVSLPGLRNAVPAGISTLGGPFAKKVAVGRAPRGGRDGVQVVLSLWAPAAFDIRRDAAGLSIVLSEEAGETVAAAGAETARAPSPAAIGPRLSLAEAIRRTLAVSTQLRLAREDSRASRGSLQQAAGQFDPSVTIVPAFQRGLNAVLQSAPASSRAVSGTELLPLTDEVDTFTIDLALPFRFRNGMVVSPFLSTQSYQDRTDSWIPTRYQSDAGLRIDWPLGKGGGTASAGAAEHAARLEADASLHQVAFTASDSVLNTVLAYWALVAAEERLALLERSCDQQRKIERLSQALVQADEISRSELDRIRARVADAEAAAAQGRQSLVAARVGLARSMGTVVADLDDAPLASDPLPPLPATGEMEKSPASRLSALAASRRADLQAARKRREAADVLLTAARIDLRPRVDLSLRAGYGGVSEDPTRGAASPAGIWDSFGGRWAGPNFALSLRFQLPFGNNAYRGQWVQAGSALEQADLTALNLSRTAGSQTVKLADSVRRSVEEVSARDVSAQENDRTVSAAFEQYRAGELSLVDAIVTERNQTQAGLDLIASRQTLAARVAQLRFETGSLVPYVVKGDDVAFGEPSAVGLSFSE